MTRGDPGEDLSTLLLAGETVEHRIEIDTATVAVTTHHLLVVDPEGTGANLRAIERPNVEEVSEERRGAEWLLAGGLKALVLGVAGMAGSRVVDFGSVFGSVDPQALSTVGAGGFVSLIEWLVHVLSVLDVVLLGSGAALVVIGIGAVAGYVSTRDTVLLVRVAGDDDVRLSARRARPEDVDRVQSALLGE
ncbi:MAG: hypothetical protein ABEJ55_00220 [Halanaeroarchaeum sp.]